jgi:hypothetical protein
MARRLAISLGPYVAAAAFTVAAGASPALARDQAPPVYPPPTIDSVQVEALGNAGNEGTGWVDIGAMIVSPLAKAVMSVSYGPSPTLGGGGVTDHGLAPGYADATNVVHLGGLNLGTLYYFQVSATGVGGTSTSPVMSFTTTAPANFFVPNPPLNVTAVAMNGAATVSFAAPVLTGKSAVKYYVISASPGALGTIVTGTTGTLTGLENGTAYTFTVHAVSTTDITGPESAPSAPVTPFYPHPLVRVTASGPIVVSARRPTLMLDMKLRAATTLIVTLLDAKGRTVAHWSQPVVPTSPDVTLPIPANARHAGHDTVHISAGSDTRTLPVTLSVA